MALREITHRGTQAVLFRLDIEPNAVKITLEAGAKAGADLRYADLSYADLRGADLRGADLSGADLRDADLRGANLREADLCGANLRGANLRGANLRHAALSRADLSGADLREADLRHAALSRADLSGADLREADLRHAALSRADLSGADLREADLRGADLRAVILTGAQIAWEGLGVPCIPQLDQGILARLNTDGTLAMARYHTCATTHCRAGWAIHLAGDAGARLEAHYGPAVAGALIYHRSAGYVPDFYASNAEALADMRARAATQPRKE